MSVVSAGLWITRDTQKANTALGKPATEMDKTRTENSNKCKIWPSGNCCRKAEIQKGKRFFAKYGR